MLCSTLKQDFTIDCFEKTLKEWEGCQFTDELRTPQVGVRAEDQVTSLMNRMMLDNRVKVVGQGYNYIAFLLYSTFALMLSLCINDKPKIFAILFARLVGRAAFTGNYLWILSENCAKETHPPEVYHRVTCASMCHIYIYMYTVYMYIYMYIYVHVCARARASEVNEDALHTACCLGVVHFAFVR